MDTRFCWVKKNTRFPQIATFYRPRFRIFNSDNKVVLRVFFLIYFGIFPSYYWVFYRLFGPIISVIFVFFFLGKRGSVRFLALISPYYQLVFLLFWLILSVFLIFLRKSGKMLKIMLIYMSTKSKRYSIIRLKMQKYIKNHWKTNILSA